MSIDLSDAATDWTGACLTDTGGTRPPPGGLVLINVQHKQHNFAHDLRLVGIRLKVEEVTPTGAVVRTSSCFVALSDPPFRVGTIQILTPSKTKRARSTTRATSVMLLRYLREADEVPQFSTYFENGVNHVAYGVRADYTLPVDWFSGQWPNCEMLGLWLSQRFIFSRYASAPPHEPSAAIMAARCHPIVKYAFTPNPAIDRSKNYHRIASIRFDYRLHLRLDRHYLVSRNLRMPQLGQSAGLFRDNDAVVPAGSVAGVIFAAIEKPLVLEAWTYGLFEGVPSIGPRTTLGWATASRSWDNVHWWGAQATGEPIISTPGAAHAAHIHWRWGGVGAIARYLSPIPEIDGGGVPSTVAQRPWGRSAKRVLVDPQIWIQTIRVAVTRNEPALDPMSPGVTLESLSREDWPTLFTSLHSTPADIYAGADLVFWYSTEVHANTYFPDEYSVAIFPARLRAGATYNSANSGSVFIHGIFFAHNPETDGAKTGSRDPEHWPRSVGQLRRRPLWFRVGS